MEPAIVLSSELSWSHSKMAPSQWPSLTGCLILQYSSPPNAFLHDHHSLTLFCLFVELSWVSSSHCESSGVNHSSQSESWFLEKVKTTFSFYTEVCLLLFHSPLRSSFFSSSLWYIPLCEQHISERLIFWCLPFHPLPGSLIIYICLAARNIENFCIYFWQFMLLLRSVYLLKLSIFTRSFIWERANICVLYIY